MGDFENLEEYSARRKREQEISCPYCGYLQNNDDGQYPVTYWGEGEDEEMICDNDDCGKKFYVKEFVIRSYETTKLEEQNNGGGH